ncbi:unnamed protein product [Chondrus crispus]|uniref:FAD:protein FMN transferase n=1 Tax=Chondrus crispus TaxID=2769 RepID=R7Q2W6_CHOCR|nr:unnamed protein product [Chondrus crispus]CDF32907.1 unnamed protein product [Chondrus crispus]|eukprot:XP_005712708.1 unnamed protein product [Chondrus crispus]
MTMPYVVLVPTVADAPAVQRLADDVFAHAHTYLNAWNPASELTAVNSQKPAKPRPLSPHLAALFDVVDRAFDLTGGRFDPTTGVISRAYENCIADNARPPLPAETARYKHAIGWRKRISRTADTVTRGNANTIVDVDGIAKGFVIDLLVAALVNAGHPNCYVDWAGDIRAQGHHPDGRPWRSAVMAPPSLKRVFGHWKDGTMDELLRDDDVAFFADFAFDRANAGKLDGAAIATSGDYFAVQRYGFHHIARADTLSVMKANQMSVASVCVAASTCAIADAVATASMTFDRLPQAVAFLQQLVDSHPDTVYGYCAMDRAEATWPSAPAKSLYSANIFSPALRSEPNSTSTSSGDEKGLSAAERQQAVGDIGHHTVTNYYRCTFDGAEIELDNFRGCSMQPEQVVLFVTDDDFFKRASLVAEDPLNQVRVELLAPRPSTSSSSSSSSLMLDERKTGVTADLSLKNISVVGGCAVVQAVVTAVSLGEAEFVQAIYRDTYLAKRAVALDVPRSKLPFYPLDKQTKTLLRQMPSAMWVVSTSAAHGEDLAMTATSVTVPAAARGMICFNVGHSSAFYAGLGGVGAGVRLFALSTRQKDIAERYVTRAALGKEDRTRQVARLSIPRMCRTITLF